MVIHATLQAGEPVFGSTLTQYMLYTVYLAAGVFTGWLLAHIHEQYIQQRIQNTHLQFDDVLSHTLRKPLLFLGFVTGAVTGKTVLTPSPAATQFLNTATHLLVILGAAWVITRFTNASIKTYVARYAEQHDGRDGKLYRSLVPVLTKTVTVIAATVTLIIVLDSLGYNVTALLTSLGIGGVAVAFAARETIADVFGGITILMSRPFVLGDAVEIGDVSGNVEEIGLRFTKIRSWDKQLVTMPNAKVASSNIVNITAEPARRIVTWIGLAYEDAADQLEEATTILTEAIQNVDGVERDTVRVWFWEYGDSALKFRLQYFITDKKNLFDVKHRVNLAVKDACDRHGIDMPYPTQREINIDGAPVSQPDQTSS